MNLFEVEKKASPEAWEKEQFNVKDRIFFEKNVLF